MKKKFSIFTQEFLSNGEKRVKEEMEKIAIGEFFKWLRVLGNSSVI
jgi:hypothetical protein